MDGEQANEIDMCDNDSTYITTAKISCNLKEISLILLTYLVLVDGFRAAPQ